MNDGDILFRRIKNIALTKPHRSRTFKEFVKLRATSEGQDFHHVFGSVHSLKSTDLLGVAVTREAHSMYGRNRAWLIEQIPGAIENLLAYVELLELMLLEPKAKEEKI